MRKIIHISDLHFGKIDATSLGSLISTFKKIHPDLIIISGDFTQRARISEFADAHAFLKRLTTAKLHTFVIPGNHDIRALYSPFSRVVSPYARYRKYISKDIEPLYKDAEIAVASINTVKRSTLKNGGIREKQLEKVEKWFSALPKNIMKIVVTHHPLDLPDIWKKHKLAKRAKIAIHRLADHTVDMYLSGHYHLSSAIHTSLRYDIKNYSAIAVQAGTLSNRQRGELPSFNIITIKKTKTAVDTFVWNPKNKLFGKLTSTTFIFKNNEWGRAPKK